MIESFRHKGLKTLYEDDTTSGVKQDQVKRLRSLLARLDASRSPADMDFPGLKLHPLQREYAGFHAVMVSGVNQHPKVSTYQHPIFSRQKTWFMLLQQIFDVV